MKRTGGLSAMRIHRLPDERVLILGVLVETGGISHSDLIEKLAAFGWSLNGVALSTLARRMQEAGMISRSRVSGQVHYRASREGVKELRTRLESCRYMAGRWLKKIHPEQDSNYEPASRKERIVTKRRAPTPTERLLILQNASKPFGALYRAQGRCNIYDLAAAEVDQFDRKRGILHLPPVSLSGRRIESRNIGIDKKLGAMLEAAIDGRTSGRIFIRSDGAPWDVDTIVSHFNHARKKAGLPTGIVLSGRTKNSSEGE
ncbi:MAG: hypothetical protein IT428_00085 [Planctomycetaceae bacterium]|nr:hypothetical protein [Planctomycetaceae bacterium]